MINLGQTESDNMNRLITITDDFYLVIFNNGTFKFDHIKRLIPLTSDYIKWLSLYLYFQAIRNILQTERDKTFHGLLKMFHLTKPRLILPSSASNNLKTSSDNRKVGKERRKISTSLSDFFLAALPSLPF